MLHEGSIVYVQSVGYVLVCCSYRASQGSNGYDDERPEKLRQSELRSTLILSDSFSAAAEKLHNLSLHHSMASPNGVSHNDIDEEIDYTDIEEKCVSAL